MTRFTSAAPGKQVDFTAAHVRKFTKALMSPGTQVRKVAKALMQPISHLRKVAKTLTYPVSLVQRDGTHLRKGGPPVKGRGWQARLADSNRKAGRLTPFSQVVPPRPGAVVLGAGS